MFKFKSISKAHFKMSAVQCLFRFADTSTQQACIIFMFPSRHHLPEQDKIICHTQTQTESGSYIHNNVKNVVLPVIIVIFSAGLVITSSSVRGVKTN